MRRFALLPLIALSAPAFAQSAPTSAQGTVAVTIYNNWAASNQQIVRQMSLFLDDEVEAL